MLQAEGYSSWACRTRSTCWLRYGDPSRCPITLYTCKVRGFAGLGSIAKRRAAVACRAEPQHVHIWLALGWCYKRNGRIDLAIESLEEALAAEPNDALVHYNLACYWSLAKNKRQALAYFRGPST